MQMHEHVLSFRIPNQDQGEVYIDIAKCMSLVNRKLYRQQGLWHVHGVCTYADVTDPNDALKTVGVPYTVAIAGAPRTWVTRNSLVKAFELWKDQQQKAYRSTGAAIKPKWQDFKIWLNQNHYENGDITPTSGHMFGNAESYFLGEWEKSKIVYVYDDNTGAVVQSEPELHILGPDNGALSKGLIEQYSESRPLQQDPDPNLNNAIDTTIYSLAEESFGDQLENIVDNLTRDNNSPPYDNVEYPGGATSGYEPILYAFAANATTSKRKLTLNGFSSPNGLLEIQFNKDSPETSVANTGELWIQLFVSHREAY